MTFEYSPVTIVVNNPFTENETVTLIPTVDFLETVELENSLIIEHIDYTKKIITFNSKIDGGQGRDL